MSQCHGTLPVSNGPLQVAQIQAAGNLYQQSAAAWSLRVLALYDLAAEKAEGGGAEIQGVVHR